MIPLSRLSEEVLSYIEESKHADVTCVLLKKTPFAEVSSKVLASQILGRRIGERKFPILLQHTQYRYPTKTSLEQSSSQWTAEYKASLIPSGLTMCDLTGGMGVDTWAFSKRARRCTYVEQDETLCSLAEYNYDLLEANISVVHSKAEAFLDHQEAGHFDCLFIDPSRRVAGNKKTSIANLEPNILELEERMFHIADLLLIKLSPMQDITEIVRSLTAVKAVHVVSLQDDVKEILVLQERGFAGNVELIAVDLDPIVAPVRYAANVAAMQDQCSSGPIGTYLYQPKPAVVKATLQDHQASSYELQKVHANTQMYSSSTLRKAYPGRIFEVLHSSQMQKKAIKKVLPKAKANIISKNHPMTPAQIAKKLDIVEGGKDYLIALTDYLEKKVLLHCKRIR